MTGSAAGRTGEDEIIARYFRPLAKHPAAFGLIDDCAALTPPAGSDLVLKTDAIIGGVVQVEHAPLTEVARFFGFFEMPFSTPFRLAVR